MNFSFKEIIFDVFIDSLKISNANISQYDYDDSIYKLFPYKKIVIKTESFSKSFVFDTDKFLKEFRSFGNFQWTIIIFPNSKRSFSKRKGSAALSILTGRVRSPYLLRSLISHIILCVSTNLWGKVLNLTSSGTLESIEPTLRSRPFKSAVLKVYGFCSAFI